MDVLKRCGVSLRWYGTALIGREGNRRPRPALRTRCRSLRAKRHSRPTVAPRSALPTAFRVVLKLLVVTRSRVVSIVHGSLFLTARRGQSLSTLGFHVGVSPRKL